MCTTLAVPAVINVTNIVINITVNIPIFITGTIVVGAIGCALFPTFREVIKEIGKAVINEGLREVQKMQKICAKGARILIRIVNDIARRWFRSLVATFTQSKPARA
jgi:hypothetical protein